MATNFESEEIFESTFPLIEGEYETKLVVSQSICSVRLVVLILIFNNLKFRVVVDV